ncbi:MAG TPA: DUF58 domain-containing protein [Bryobacterales bacterium]|nr:DUF58 domain-containing protein [Bryobacterales bacterium]
MAMQTLLDPKILSGLSNIELVARTVVDGFLTGLHRSPVFGFSLEFAEYRPYTPGDDPRFIDWNVFSRTDRTYLKRYLGETNTHLMLLLDASASMGFSSHAVSKMQYARFLGAALSYLSIRQHDAAGLIVFDEKVREYRPPSTRSGHLRSLLHILEHAEPATGTNLDLPFDHFRQYSTMRGLVAVISDFYMDPASIVKAVRPLAYQGQDIVFFHVLDPAEQNPDFDHSILLEDMETGDQMEISPDFARGEYRERMAAHIESLRSEVNGIRADYVLLNTSQPLDMALREYLLFRQRRR